MFCPKCGAQVAQEAHFCSACGSQIGTGSGPAPAPVQIQISQPQSTPAIEKKKMATWKKVLLWIVGIITVIIALAYVATGDLQSLAEAHLDSLRKGDIQTAYSHTSPEFQKATPFAAYQKFVDTYPVLAQHTQFSMESRGFENDTGYVRGHLTDGTKNLAKIDFQLVKIGDQWKIQGFNLKAPE